MTRMVFALMSLLLLPRPAVADEGKEVKAFIERKANKVLSILKNKKLDKGARKKKVVAVADSMFDLPLMAKLSLGRKHWPKFDKTQRREFTDLFIKQLRASYTEKVDLLSDETVEFAEPVKKKKKYHVLTYIVSKDQRYEMLYKLYKKKGAWKVYDVEVEGISIVKSYGKQYEQFLRKGTAPGLLKKMREKAFAIPKDLREKGDEIKAEQKAGSGAKSPPPAKAGKDGEKKDR